MPPEVAWLRVEQECPRRIIGPLHRSGAYQHGTTARFPGKVLCCHKGAALPEDWTPTPAQEQAWRASGAHAQAPPA